MADDAPLAPLSALLAAHGGRNAEHHRALWTFDARLADIVRTTTEPLIGQMRMTWWHEALTDESGAKGRGEPLADRLKASIAEAPQLQPALLAMIDGWETFLLAREGLDDAALEAFARGRGSGLFHALCRTADAPDWLGDAGAVWALWDLSGHVSDASSAELAIRIAARIDREMGPWRRGWAPARIAYGLARRDVARVQVAAPGLTPRLYARFMRLAFLGG